MKNTKHTPGPWTVVDASEPSIKADGWIIASTFTPYKALDMTEQVANARLIAAAPEMFDLLKRLECCAFSPDGQCIVGKETLKLIMRDLAGIIAKAEGREE